MTTKKLWTAPDGSKWEEIDNHEDILYEGRIVQQRPTLRYERKDTELDFSEVDSRVCGLTNKFYNFVIKKAHACDEIALRHEFEDFARAIVKLAREK